MNRPSWPPPGVADTYTYTQGGAVRRIIARSHEMSTEPDDPIPPGFTCVIVAYILLIYGCSPSRSHLPHDQPLTHACVPLPPRSRGGVLTTIGTAAYLYGPV